MEVVDRGVPVQPEVDKLFEAFRDVAEGVCMTHGQIAEVIGEDPGTNRYRTIICAWKDFMLLQHGVQLGSVHGQGYRKLPPTDRLNASVKTFAAGVRKQERALDNTLRIDRKRLSPQENVRADHMVNLGATALLHSRLAVRTFTAKQLPSSVEALPRLGPPAA